MRFNGTSFRSIAFIKHACWSADSGEAHTSPVAGFAAAESPGAGVTGSLNAGSVVFSGSLRRVSGGTIGETLVVGGVICGVTA
jgi:hypothetical protein